MYWLNRNIRLYRDLHIPTVDALPTRIIIDDSHQVESENTAIEFALNSHRHRGNQFE
jgi:hypothetical protein